MAVVMVDDDLWDLWRLRYRGTMHWLFVVLPESDMKIENKKTCTLDET